MRITAPCVVIGDIHGQYHDLCKLFETNEKFHMPSVFATKINKKNNYLFLGDYVDRGDQGIEVVAFLYAFKIAFPKRVFLLRGNHECRAMTALFSFRSECLEKYDEEVYNLIMESFDVMTFCAVVAGTFICTHGGIGPGIKNTSTINNINRFQEVPEGGDFADMLWSDPVQDENADSVEFDTNTNRGCGYYFGYEPLKKFL